MGEIMKSLSKLLIFGLLVASVASEAEDVAATEEANNEARVLVGKHIQNKYLVEGMDLVVKYSLFNIGDAAAVDLTLTENGFGMDDFDIVGGQPSVKYDRLAQVPMLHMHLSSDLPNSVTLILL